MFLISGHNFIFILNLWNIKSENFSTKCMFSSSISKNDKLGVKLKHKWKHPCPSITRTLNSCKILKYVSVHCCQKNLKKKVPKIIKIHIKNYYKVKGFTWIYIYSQLPIVSWEARVHEIKLFDQRRAEICDSIKLRTQFFISALKYGPASLHRQNNDRRKKMMQQKGDGII